MAYPAVNFRHTGLPGAQAINETSGTQRHALGLVVEATDFTYGPGKFIYCVGAASTAPGEVCCFDSVNGDTVRAVHGGATSTGPCGIAMSANVAGQYGWYQTEGAGPVKSGTVAADAPLYLTSTAGTVDDAVVAGDKIDGIVSRTADSAGYVTAQMANPSVTSDSSVSGSGALLRVTLSAAVEAAEAIVVSGVVEDLSGLDASSAKLVRVATMPVTANKGDITVTVGTELKTVNPATGENVSWIETTAAGLFAVSVANDVAEVTMVHASVNGGIPATLKLTFA